MTWEKIPAIVLSWTFWAENTNRRPEMFFRPLSTLATSLLILQPRPWCFKERKIPEGKLSSKGGNVLLPITEPLGLGEVTINKVQTNHSQGSNWGVHTEVLHVTRDAQRYLAWPPAAAEEAESLCMVQSNLLCFRCPKAPGMGQNRQASELGLLLKDQWPNAYV